MLKKSVIALLSVVLLFTCFFTGYYLGMYFENYQTHSALLEKSSPVSKLNSANTMADVEISIKNRKITFNEDKGEAEHTEKITNTTAKELDVENMSVKEFNNKYIKQNYLVNWIGAKKVELINNDYQNGLYVLKSDDGNYIKIQQVLDKHLEDTKEYASKMVKDLDNDSKESLKQGLLVYKTLNDAKGFGGNVR
ncbi:MAG: hypothetical protein Q8936_05715 [Bacillota bacterium]|nr:hypothetical protein [Bacillota bacterium]